MLEQEFQKYITNFKLHPTSEATEVQHITVDNFTYPLYVNEFWTAQQRQANAIHEVSYRACFKPQLPRFFITLFTQPGDTVYDPFNGRGTTVVEASLLNRNIIANDVNPISLIFTHPRITIPTLQQIEDKLQHIKLHTNQIADIDLSMFYSADTLSEIVSLRNYLIDRKKHGLEDDTDKWIRMVATNRLTGHSKGFFSVYTLPPNQAVSARRQIKINATRNQVPEYRDIKKLILKKTKVLLRDIDPSTKTNVSATLLNSDASLTNTIPANTVTLTVTSPPFLDVVQYAEDNWLRCWFNNIDYQQVASTITMSKTVVEWSQKMQQVFNELYRITKPGGIVAFEVGEIKNGKIRLEEAVIPVGIAAGFACEGVLINEQIFTKTANIWGVNNNKAGTNSNRIVLFRKTL